MLVYFHWRQSQKRLASCTWTKVFHVSSETRSLPSFSELPTTWATVGERHSTSTATLVCFWGESLYISSVGGSVGLGLRAICGILVSSSVIIPSKYWWKGRLPSIKLLSLACNLDRGLIWHRYGFSWGSNFSMAWHCTRGSVELMTECRHRWQWSNACKGFQRSNRKFVLPTIIVC